MHNTPNTDTVNQAIIELAALIEQLADHAYWADVRANGTGCENQTMLRDIKDHARGIPFTYAIATQEASDH